MELMEGISLGINISFKNFFYKSIFTEPSFRMDGDGKVVLGGGIAEMPTAPILDTG